MFRTHQGHLPWELALAGIDCMSQDNRYMAEVYRPALNAEFMLSAMEEGSAFVGWIGGAIDDILCERFERTVGNDKGVSLEEVKLQNPADDHRCHCVKAKAADYDRAGHVTPRNLKAAA